MKKKELKKLSLKKDVVSRLENEEMMNVKGGAGGIVIKTNTSYNCPTGGHTKPPMCCDYGCCETLNCQYYDISY